MTGKIFGLALIAALSIRVGHAQVIPAASQSATDSVALLLGQWNGSFEGASSGKLEMTLQRDSSTHQLGGQLTVILSDGARYSTKLKQARFINQQFSASYIEPDDGSEIRLQGQLSGPVLKGDWVVSDGQARGSWRAIHPLR